MKRLFLLGLLCASPVSAQDAFDLCQSQIVNAPNVCEWRATATVTALVFDGATTKIEFTKQDGIGRWPDVRPAGWDGDIQYTLWLFLKVNGRWTGSAFVEFWYGRERSGEVGDPDVPSRYHVNYYYAARWAPLFGHGQIQPGESIGFMVTSGDARDSKGPYGPQERSNVVVVNAADRGAFTFTAPPVATPPPMVIAPPPTPPPTPPVSPAPLPSTDLSPILNQLAADQAQVLAAIADVKRDIAEFRAAVRSKWAAFINHPVIKYGSAIALGWLAKFAVAQ